MTFQKNANEIEISRETVCKYTIELFRKYRLFHLFRIRHMTLSETIQYNILKIALFKVRKDEVLRSYPRCRRYYLRHGSL